MAKSRGELALLKCVPCRGGIPPLQPPKITELLQLIPGWKLSSEGPDKIEKSFKFKDFTEAMMFVNGVAEIADEEDHHPDIFIHYNKVTLSFWTHAINGLFDNDFIMAAKVEGILENL